MKRINSLTNISDSDVEKKINDLEKYFHFTTKDSIVKNCFSQTASTSTIELFSLIDAIEHCNCIDSDWVKKIHLYNREKKYKQRIWFIVGNLIRRNIS